MDDSLSASLSSLMTNSPSWNLSNDDVLLEVLRNVSQNFLSRTSNILDKMDRLSLETASVQTRLDNANNNFMLLSNIKFIEARVYDDNEENEQENSNISTEETENEDTIISEALKCGTDLVDTGFEKVAINDSDTESDEDSGREVYVLQPKNSYHLRSLPNIIGTEEWITDDKIGLGDDDQEDGVNEDQETESESEDEDIQGEADVSDFSESENEERKLNIPQPPKNYTNNELSEDGDTASEFSDDDDDLFKPRLQNDPPKAPTVVDEKSEEEEEDTDNGKEEDAPLTASPDIRGVKKTSFADELALKLGGSGVASGNGGNNGSGNSGSGNNASGNNASVNSGKSGSSEKQRGDEKPSVSVSKRSTLFDSSDSDDDLFSPKPPLPKLAAKPTPQLSSQAKISEVKQIQTTNSGNAEIKRSVTEGSQHKVSIPSEKPPPPPAAKKPPLAQKTIFSDSSDEDDIFADLKVGAKSTDMKDEKKSFLAMSEGSDSDDIFANLGVDLKQKKEFEAVKTDFSEERNSDNDDIFANTFKDTSITKTDFVGDSKETDSKKKAPAGGVSIFSGFNPANIFKKNTVSSDDEPDDDVHQNEDFDQVSKKSGKEGGTEVDQLGQTISEPTEAVLDDDDDIFSVPIKDKTNAHPEPEGDSKNAETAKDDSKKKAPAGGVSIFSGFNPANIFKKNAVSSDDEPDDDVHQNEDLAPVSKEFGKEGGTEVDKPTESTRAVSEINDSDGFMVENKTEVLATLTKSRPRIGGQRRPPSRSARKREAVTSVFQDTTDGIDQDTEDVSKPDASKEESSNSERKPLFKPPSGGVSLFGNINPKDVLKRKPKIEDTEENDSIDAEKAAPTLKNDKPGNSLFENLLPKKKTDDATTSAINSTSDDFMGEDDDLFAPKTLVTDQDDKGLISGFEPPPMDVSSPKKLSVDIFGEDSEEDDLFSDLMVKKTEVNDKAVDVNNLFGDDDDDEFDDLFSSLMKK